MIVLSLKVCIAGILFLANDERVRKAIRTAAYGLMMYAAFFVKE
jgi:hypothetical protein